VGTMTIFAHDTHYNGMLKPSPKGEGFDPPSR
jgi:hypothetical protein